MFESQMELQNIYTDFKPRIVRYLSRLVGENEAEDLAQETFIKVEHALASFRGEAKVSTWLYRIATNTALDRLRSPIFRREAEEIFSDDPLDDNSLEVFDYDAWSGDKKPSIEKQVVRDEMKTCLMGRSIVCQKFTGQCSY